MFPVRHLIQQMVDVFNPVGSGIGVTAAHTGVMLAWGVGAILISLRRFHWEPHTG